MSVLVFGGRSPIALALCKQLIESGREVHLVTREVDGEIQAIATRLKISALHQCNHFDTGAGDSELVTGCFLSACPSVLTIGTSACAN